MAFITHNDQPQIYMNAGGTSLQGYIEAKYADLVALFGKPTDGDAEKVDAEWYVQFEDGTFATIYNWKTGKNYKGAGGLPVEKIKDWHIGGKTKDSHTKIQIALDLFREQMEADKPKDDFEKAFESAIDIMESIRSTRGENFAHVIEGALIIRKQTELTSMLISVLKDTEAVPPEALKMLTLISTEMSARILSKLAKVAGVVQEGKGAENAEDIMGWVEKVMQAEQSGARNLFDSLVKGEGKE